MEPGSPDRFERQADIVPREKLMDETVTIIGVGAIGRQVAIQLASMGVPNLQLIDFDVVEHTNVTTQGYMDCQAGLAKVDAMYNTIIQIDPDIAVDTVNDRFRPHMEVGGIVFCCVDSIQTRSIIWKNLRHKVAFWADGRMLGEVMRILVATNPREADHYETTLFRPEEAQRGACTAKGVIYTAAIAAGLMMHQFTRWLRDIEIDPDVSLNLMATELVPENVT